MSLLWMLSGLAGILGGIVFIVACNAVLLAQTLFFGMVYGTLASALAVLGCMLLVVVAIAIHELGHAIAAVTVRWRVLQVAVGPLIWEKQGDRFKLRLENWRYSGLGQVVSTPTDLRRYLLRASIVYSGGIVANLLTALACLAVLLALPTGSAPLMHRDEKTLFQFFFKADDWITALAQAALIMNLAFALNSLIPFQIRKFSSDGMHLLRLLLARPLGTVPTVLVRPGLGGSLFHGSRPGEWDGEIIQRLIETAKAPPQKADAQLCAYYRALDRGQVEEAGALLDQALSSVDELKGSIRSAILLEAAYFEGFYRRHAAVARKWLHQATIRELEEHTFLRAAAAVLLAEGLFAPAAASAEAALTRAKKASDRGGALAEKEWLWAIRNTCQERIKANETQEPSVS
jgi:hypothetical protein